MNVHIDGHVIEMETLEDVALFIACLLPTREDIESAKRAMLAERAATGLVLTEDGRIIGEVA